MTLIHNEQTKLTASAFDRASTACLTVGVIAPVAATFFNLGGAPGAAASALEPSSRER